jgi:Flp pilus assembly protein TadG
MLLVAATIDFARVFASQITITNAAREGALAAAQYPTSYIANTGCTTANKATNRVMCRAINEAKGSWVTISPADVTMTCSPSCTTGLGNSVTVRVAGHFTVLTPIISVFTGTSNVTLASTATAQIGTAPANLPATTPTPSPTPTPTPAPTPTPTPAPSGQPTPTPTPAPTPTPTPNCFAPVANFTVNPTTGSRYRNNGHPGTTFAFTNTTTNMSAGCNPIWSWNFGDGSGTSSLQNPTYLYTTANTSPGFTVTLVASNSAGSSSKSVVIPVTP